MPHRNVIREFTEDTSYHAYNRGVEKRVIFADSQDYNVFLSRLRLMLIDRSRLDEKELPRQPIKSFFGEVELLAYCLMPNHFHLLLHQNTNDGIAEFMRTLSTSYTMYFNKRYERVGALFQGRYKARRVDTDAYRQHISRYIHLNPTAISRDIENFEYSSMRHFRNQEEPWISYDRVLEDFTSYDDYLKFILEYSSPDALEQLKQDYSIE